MTISDLIIRYFCYYPAQLFGEEGEGGIPKMLLINLGHGTKCDYFSLDSITTTQDLIVPVNL
jgi:hypothetical protein